MMRTRFARTVSLAALFSIVCVASSLHAMESAVVSTMRNVNAVNEARGFYLIPANDMAGKVYGGDLAPTQAFEIVRPGMGRVTIGRLYTSCTCVQLHSPKRNFSQGERAVLELRNVHPTPASGQNYAIYVQITSPIRTTLRYDTFVQSSQFVSRAPEPIVIAADPASAGDDEQDAPEAADPVVQTADAVDDDEATDEPAAPVIAADPASDEEPAEEQTGGIEVAVEEPEETPAAAPVEDTPPVRDLSGFKVEPRISLITLGVADLGKSVAFYEALGWEPVGRGKYDTIIFFQLNGMVLSLYPAQDLLKDQNLQGREPVAGGVTLAINVREKDEVRAAYDRFIAAGGKSLREPEETPSGAMTAYVADPDGHAWEISWVPHFKLNDKGELWLE